MEKNPVRYCELKGFDYSVDDQGNVYSAKRGNSLISQFSYMGGTPAVQLYKRNGSGKVMRVVSRLVAEAFVPNPLKLRFVVHKNGDRRDNRAENLMWSAGKKSDPVLKGETWKQVPNMPGVKVSSKMRVKMDGYLIKPVMFSDGEKVILPGYGARSVNLLKAAAFPYDYKPKKNRAILTAQQVSEIKRDYTKREITMQSLADKYGVSKTAIHQIVTGKSWPHIKPAENTEKKVLRPDSPFHAVNALKAGIPIEVSKDDLFGYFLYITRKAKSIYFKCEEDAYNEGFTVFFPK